MILERDVLYINGQLVKEVFKIGRNRFYKTVNNEILPFPSNTSVEMKCNRCGNFIHQKKFRCHLQKFSKQKYLCQSCRMFLFNPFKGKKHSKESKEKQRLKKIGKYIGKNNPMYGKSCTDYMDDNKIALWKLHISESVKGKNNPMYGKDWRIGKTKEEILSRNNNIKNTFANKTKEEKAEISRKISESQKRLKELDPVKYREQKAKAGRISVKNQSMYKINKIEKKVYDWLLEHNIAFEYSCIMGDGINNYQYDFIIKNKRILIEVQGDYWHGNPMFFNKEGSDNKRKLNDIQIKKKNYDILKYNFSIEKNFKLLYIWEYDINNDDFSALKELLDENKTT